MTTETAFYLSDNILRLYLKDEQGTYQNTATVTASLQDSTAQLVSGAESITLTHDGNGKGVYEAVLEDTLPLVLGSPYKAIVVAQSNGFQRRFVKDLVIVE